MHEIRCPLIYRAGVVVVHSSFARMNTRRLLYTAVTRAKELLCLVGEKRALAQAVATTRENDRRTALVERLQQEKAEALKKAA